MENVLITRIVETEKEADKIIFDAKIYASNLIKRYNEEYLKKKKQIEKKYDDELFSNQELIDKELNQNFDIKLKEKKVETSKLKVKLEKEMDKALSILFSGVDDNGNS